MYHPTTLSFLLAFLHVSTVSGKGATYPPKPADLTTPVQQRISFKHYNAVSVAWNTFEKLHKACVHYGTDKDDLSRVTCSTTSVTYPTSRTWKNLVHLEGLKPATTYYYKIGSTNSSMNFFQTARLPGDMTEFRMITLADLGLFGKNGATVTKRSMVPEVEPALNHTTIGALARTIDDYEFLIHPGDFSYADDWMYSKANTDHGAEAYNAINERFFDQLSPITSRKPYMVGPGNHEADCTEDNYHPGVCPNGQFNFSDYRNRFDGMMPHVFTLGQGGDSTAVKARESARKLARPPFWYSFDYGMAHIVMINTETDFPDAPDESKDTLDAGPFGAAHQQRDFLHADLASVNRKVTPWVIAAGHRPFYTNGGGPCDSCQRAFEDTFYKYGVDVAVFGHVHNLQRFAPIYKNNVDSAGMNNPKAPMYTVIGAAGNIEGLSPISPKMTGNEFAYMGGYGFGSLTFYNSTHLGVDYYESKSGKNLDSTTLYKKHDVAFVRQ